MNNYTTIRRAQIMILLLSIAILILYGIQLYIAQSLTTQGIELGKLQRQIQAVTTVNRDLRIQVLTGESYLTIASEAAQMGFTESAKVLP